MEPTKTHNVWRIPNPPGAPFFPGKTGDVTIMFPYGREREIKAFIRAELDRLFPEGTKPSTAPGTGAIGVAESKEPVATVPGGPAPVSERCAETHYKTETHGARCTQPLGHPGMHCVKHAGMFYPLLMAPEGSWVFTGAPTLESLHTSQGVELEAPPSTSPEGLAAKGDTEPPPSGEGS